MLILRTVLLQVIVGVLLSFTSVTVAGVEQVPLPAVWQFQLDPDDIGVHGKWFDADLQSEPWIPLGTPAGLWRGRVHLTPLRSGPDLEVPFELRVVPVVLPERVPIWVTFWSYSPGYGWGAEGRGKSKAYLDLMR